MEPDATYDITLSSDDLMAMRAGLTSYLQAYDEHRALDRGATHPDEERAQLRRHVGELIWRLENAEGKSGTVVAHSDEAVDPRLEDGDSGV